MSLEILEIRTAQTEEEIMDALKLRFRVYVEQEKVMPPNDSGTIGDAFDKCGKSTILNAYNEAGKCVGTIRFVPYTKASGVPYQQHFNFEEIVRLRKFGVELERSLVAIGMLAIEEDYRLKHNLSSSLIKNVTSLVSVSKYLDLIAIVNHQIAASLRRIGMMTLETKRLSGDIENTVEVMYGTVEDIQKSFPEEMLPDTLMKLVPCCRRLIVSRGGEIMRQGECGDEVYFLMSGTTGTYVSSGQQSFKIANSTKTPGKGEYNQIVLGDMAVLSGNKGGIRTATISVVSRLAEFFVIDGSSFRRAVYGESDPDFDSSLAFLLIAGVLSPRIANLNVKLSEISPKKDIEDRLRRFLESFESRVVEAHLSCGGSDGEGGKIFDFKWLANEIGVEYDKIEPLAKQLIRSGAVIINQHKDIVAVDKEKLAEMELIIDLI